MQIFVPVSQTGGVGKSTYSWNLAWRYARRFPGERVLFVDMTKAQGTRSMRICPQQEVDGNGLGRALNNVFSVILEDVPFYKQQADIAEGLSRGAETIRKSVVKVWGDKQHTIQIDVLPAASARLNAVIKSKWNEPEEGTILGNLFKQFEDEYDLVIFDVTPDIGCVSVRSAMRIADGIVSIQSVKSEDTIQGIAQLLGAVEDVGGSFKGFVANLHLDNRAESNTALGELAKACEDSNLPLLRVVRDLGSIANTTRIHKGKEGEVVSGLYAELDSTNPSIRQSLQAFEKDLDVILDALLGLPVTSIASEFVSKEADA